LVLIKDSTPTIKTGNSHLFKAMCQIKSRLIHIMGYYTLSTLSIELSQLPQVHARKLPRHPVPAALLGRLAVNQAAQSHGVGKMLLVDAIKRTLAVSDEIAIYAMVVDAIDERALHFYEQFGFSLLSSGNLRLFLPLKSI